MSTESKDVATPRPKWTGFCFVKPARHEIREGDDRIILIADVLPEHVELICDAVNAFDSNREAAVRGLYETLKYLKRHVAAQDVERVESVLAAYQEAVKQ